MVVITSALVVLAFTFAVTKLFKLNTEPLKKMDVAALTDGHSVKLNVQQAVITVIMIVAYIYPVLLMPLPQESSIYVTLNTIGQPMFMGLAVAVLALLHKDGKPFYDVEKFIGSDIMWGAIAAYALVSVASGAVASDAAGINAWLQIVISSVVADLPLAVVLIVFLLIATYLTQVFSNMATIIIISSVLAPMLPLFVEQGFNVSVIPAFVLQGGMSAIMTAGGSGFAAMMLAQPAFEGDGGAWALKKGAVILLVFSLCAAITTVILGYLL